MIKYEDMGESILKKRDSWKASRNIWLESYKKQKEYFYGDVEGTRTRYTVEQLNKIKSEGFEIPLSINFIYHLIEQELAILTENKPTFKIVSLDERGKEYGYILEKASRSILYYSNSIGEEEEAIKTMLIGGIGITGLSEDDEYMVGTFGISYNHIDPETIILDANSRRRDYKDAQGYFIEKEILIEEAKTKYQDLLEIISEYYKVEIDINNLGYARTDTKPLPAKDWNDTVVITEYYDYIYTDMYYLKTIEGQTERVFKENYFEESFEVLGNLIFDKEYGKYVRRKTYINDKLLLEVVLPYMNFPISIKYFEWGGDTYHSYGAIHFIKDMQNAYDRLMHTFLINGILSNNPSYTAPENSIRKEREEDWTTRGNRPGQFKFYNPVIIGNSIMKPEKESVTALSNFYPMTMEMLKASMENATGINSIMQGNAQEANVDVFSSMQQYQSIAMQRLKLVMSHINLANEKLGNVLVSMLVDKLKNGMTHMFFNDKGKIDELAVTKEIIENVKLSKFLILSTPAEATQTAKNTMVAGLMQIIQTTSDPIQRDAYMRKAFELSDIRGYDEVADDMAIADKQRARIGQLEEELKRKEELTKQFENRAERSETTAKVIDGAYKQLIPLLIEFAKMDKDIDIIKLQERIVDLKKVNKMEESNIKSIQSE